VNSCKHRFEIINLPYVFDTTYVPLHYYIIATRQFSVYNYSVNFKLGTTLLLLSAYILNDLEFLKFLQRPAP
jgi:hypothetical protein